MVMAARCWTANPRTCGRHGLSPHDVNFHAPSHVVQTVNERCFFIGQTWSHTGCSFTHGACFPTVACAGLVRKDRIPRGLQQRGNPRFRSNQTTNPRHDWKPRNPRAMGQHGFVYDDVIQTGRRGSNSKQHTITPLNKTTTTTRYIPLRTHLLKENSQPTSFHTHQHHNEHQQQYQQHDQD